MVFVGEWGHSANDTCPDGYFILAEGLMRGFGNIPEVGSEWASEREKKEVYLWVMGRSAHYLSFVLDVRMEKGTCLGKRANWPNRLVNPIFINCFSYFR